MSKLSKAWRLLRTNRRELLLGVFNNLGFITRYIPDKQFLKIQWRLAMGSKLDLENPKTFNEKLQWLKLYDRRPEYTMMVDKYRVKEYVASKIGEEHVIPLLGVWEDPTEIDFDALPNQFVLKCNHNSCGGMCICQDKSKLDIAQVKKGLARGLKDDYYLHGREWPYKDVPRRVIAEEYISGDLDSMRGGGGLRDYKFFCFNGKCRLIYVDTGYLHHHVITFFDTDWQRMPFERQDFPSTQEQISKPKNLKEMIAFAELLAKDIPFARMDFYSVSGKTYFGEVTLSPAAGYGKFSPEEWDSALGGWLELPVQG